MQLKVKSNAHLYISVCILCNHYPTVPDTPEASPITAKSNITRGAIKMYSLLSNAVKWVLHFKNSFLNSHALPVCYQPPRARLKHKQTLLKRTGGIVYFQWKDVPRFGNAYHHFFRKMAALGDQCMYRCVRHTECFYCLSQCNSLTTPFTKGERQRVMDESICHCNALVPRY